MDPAGSICTEQKSIFISRPRRLGRCLYSQIEIGKIRVARTRVGPIMTFTIAMALLAGFVSAEMVFVQGKTARLRAVNNYRAC